MGTGGVGDERVGCAMVRVWVGVGAGRVRRIGLGTDLHDGGSCRTCAFGRDGLLHVHGMDSEGASSHACLFA